MRFWGLITMVVVGGLSACQCGGDDWCTGNATRPCPLQQGVCAGSVSRCIDGHWTACEYGPDYQLTERRCDGLDNDCDGTVDSSGIHVLIEADAGRAGALLGAEVNGVSVVPGSQGHWLSLPNDLLVIDDNLDPAARTRFPMAANGRAWIFPNGSEWLRISNHVPVDVPPGRVQFHRVFADGGFSLEPDGGPRLVAEVLLPPNFGGLRAAFIDGGWVAVTKPQGYVPSGGGHGIGAWARLEVDGGLRSGFFDAGSTPFATQSIDLASRGGTFLFSFVTNDWGHEIYEADLATSNLHPRLSATGSCWLATVDPLTVGCHSAPYLWTDDHGGVLLSSPIWAASGLHEDGEHLLAFATAPGWDGQGPLSSISLGEVQDGGVSQFLEVGGFPATSYLQVHELGGRLVLVTWGDRLGAAPCPGCEIGRFVARYACLPP